MLAHPARASQPLPVHLTSKRASPALVMPQSCHAERSDRRERSRSTKHQARSTKHEPSRAIPPGPHDALGRLHVERAEPPRIRPRDIARQLRPSILPRGRTLAWASGPNPTRLVPQTGKDTQAEVARDLRRLRPRNIRIARICWNLGAKRFLELQECPE